MTVRPVILGLLASTASGSTTPRSLHFASTATPLVDMVELNLVPYLEIGDYVSFDQRTDAGAPAFCHVALSGDLQDAIDLYSCSTRWKNIFHKFKPTFLDSEITKQILILNVFVPKVVHQGELAIRPS